MPPEPGGDLQPPIRARARTTVTAPHHREADARPAGPDRRKLAAGNAVKNAMVFGFDSATAKPRRNARVAWSRSWTALAGVAPRLDADPDQVGRAGQRRMSNSTAAFRITQLRPNAMAVSSRALPSVVPDDPW